MRLEDILEDVDISIKDYRVQLPYRMMWNKDTKEAYFHNRLYKPLGMRVGTYKDPKLKTANISVVYLYEETMNLDLLAYKEKLKKLLESMIDKGYQLRSPV